MSATKDKNSKIGWSYSNVYRIHGNTPEPVKNFDKEAEDFKSKISQFQKEHDQLKVMISNLEKLLKG